MSKNQNSITAEDFEEFFGQEPLQIHSQELPEDLGTENSGVEESPAQNVDNNLTQRGGRSDRGVVLEKFLLKIEKLTIEINNAMKNSNDIERTLMPVLKKGMYIHNNLDQEIGRSDGKTVAYKLRDIISQSTSSFYTADGNVKNIKFALTRMQDVLDDMKELLEEPKIN